MPLRLSQFGNWLRRTAQRSDERDFLAGVNVMTPAQTPGAIRTAGTMNSRTSAEPAKTPSPIELCAHNKANAVADSLSDRFMLWIDGVGAYQLCAGDQFLIGAPTQEHASPDICLLANLSRKHATLQRTGEDWFIHPHQATVVSGRPAIGPTLLRTGDAICLAERVKLGFRIPSVLGGSALIDFESHHRPVHSVDGIILMTDRVLLGPRRDHHICCPDWPELVVIYRQDGQLRCKSKAALTVNNERVRDSAVLSDGAVIAGEDFRFRVERLK
jgi:hypothetical protein